MLDTLGGAIFTDQEIFIYGAIIFIVASFIVGTVLYVGKLMFNKLTSKKVLKSTRLLKTTLLGAGIIAILLFLFLILPTVIEDRNWQKKQQECAIEVGYDSPADNNSINVTAKEQSDYDDCLNKF